MCYIALLLGCFLTEQANVAFVMHSSLRKVGEQREGLQRRAETERRSLWKEPRMPSRGPGAAQGRAGRRVTQQLRAQLLAVEAVESGPQSAQQLRKQQPWVSQRG